MNRRDFGKAVAVAAVADGISSDGKAEFLFVGGPRDGETVMFHAENPPWLPAMHDGNYHAFDEQASSARVVQNYYVIDYRERRLIWERSRECMIQDGVIAV